MSCGVSRESGELRFIHKAWRHEHGERRSADTGAAGAGRKKGNEAGWREREGEDRDKAGKGGGGKGRKGETQQRSRGVDECVSPIMFTQFHPSNKSFKTGIREKVKAKHRRDAQGSQTNILYSTAANCFLQ